MRTIMSKEIKEGLSKVAVPSMNIVVGSWWDGEKVDVGIEIDTEDKELTEIAFLLVGVGEEIKEDMVVNLIGMGYVKGRPMLAYEVV